MWRSRSAETGYALWSNGTKLEAWNDGKVGSALQRRCVPLALHLPAGGVLAAWEENGAIEIRRLP
jgi:hypothetical protein